MTTLIFQCHLHTSILLTIYLPGLSSVPYSHLPALLVCRVSVVDGLDVDVDMFEPGNGQFYTFSLFKQSFFLIEQRINRTG
jgi:hypothetical protein